MLFLGTEDRPGWLARIWQRWQEEKQALLDEEEEEEDEGETEEAEEEMPEEDEPVEEETAAENYWTSVLDRLIAVMWRQMLKSSATPWRILIFQ
jgi:hypothetical protein